jgi:hypothetical protein
MNEPKPKSWGGSRPGSGRKFGPKKVRIEPAYVLKATAKEINRQKKQKKKTLGELLDERFKSEERKMKR